MKRFTYTIADPLGIHARPAGLLARTAKEYPDTEIVIAKGEASAKATQLMRIMAMGVRQGDQVTITAEGGSEERAIRDLRKFFEENL
jgi:phosphocarrier protein